MKTRIRTLVALSVMLLAGWTSAVAQDLSGIWQGKLQVDPTTALTIQFTFTRKPDGVYSAVLNSPDNDNIKNVAANSVSWSAGALKVQVAELSGSYAGVLKGGSIDGQWTQEGSALPLSLSPYQKPKLSKAAIDTLVGSWHGPLKLPGGSLTFVTRFRVDDKGELQGSLAVPEQGGVELAMSDIEFADDKLAFKIQQIRGQLTARYANGVLAGAWRQGGNPPDGLPVTLKKGEFAAPAHQLKLSAESFAALSGKWTGTLQAKTPQGKEISLPLVLRFEVNAQDQHVGFIDSPSQGAKDIPVTEATLTDGKLMLKVAAVSAEFQAALSGKTLVGKWSQGPMNNPLTLTRQ